MLIKSYNPSNNQILGEVESTDISKIQEITYINIPSFKEFAKLVELAS